MNMTAKTLPAASQVPLWGMSNNPANAVLGRPGASSAVLDCPDQNGAMPLSVAGVPSSVVDAPDFGPPNPAGSYWLAFTGGRVTKGTRTGYTLSEGQIIHGAGVASSPANPGKPARTVEL